MTIQHTLQEFSRYEFKYILKKSVRDEIESEVQHFMRYDGHIDPEIANTYFVRSLYYDSPSSFNFYEKIDGVKLRKKFRLRTYSKSPNESPLYIEQKGRNENRVFKHRVNIEYDDLPKFYKGDDIEWLVNNFSDFKIINQYIYDVYRRNISPVVLVDYRRAPYVSDFDMNFRVTFDSNITAKATDVLFDDNNISIDCLPGYTILEVKFNRKIPAWFHKIILAYNLQRVSVSKFVLGMKRTNIAQDLS